RVASLADRRARVVAQALQRLARGDACGRASLARTSTIAAHDKGERTMAEVLLFHHAMGQTEGFRAFADELRQAGHTVHTPDLFEGRTFGSIEDGMAYVGELGFGEIIARGDRAADDLPE